MADTVTLTIVGQPDTAVVYAPEVVTLSVPVVETVALVVEVPDHGQAVGLLDDDHPQYVTWVKSAVRPDAPRDGTIWVPEL